MTKTPRNARLHIGIFGRRNAGKSTLLNAISGQNAAVTSPIKGTTTDPVYKSMELLPIGPVVMIDTPGIDDEGELGAARVKKTRQILRKTDIAVLLYNEDIAEHEQALISLFGEMGIPYVVVQNRDCKEVLGRRSNPEETNTLQYNADSEHVISINALSGENITAVKNAVIKLAEETSPTLPLVADLLSPADAVILVTPIDSGAPKGRLILPQQQVIRDILDARCVPILSQPEQLAALLTKITPKMVITDSQVFKTVAEIVPQDIALTSFSIIMARYKGVLDEAVRGAAAIDTIQTGDMILISEGCTHHRQCDDIGTVKIPGMIEACTGTKPQYTFTSGGDFPDELSDFKLIIHCGACMLNTREMLYRQRAALESGVAITNYGVAISHMQGILARCTMPPQKHFGVHE